VSNYAGLKARFNEFFTNRDFLKRSGDLAGGYVKSGTGASKRIVDRILDSPGT
jgi:hypothetical protein